MYSKIKILRETQRKNDRDIGEKKWGGIERGAKMEIVGWGGVHKIIFEGLFPPSLDDLSWLFDCFFVVNQNVFKVTNTVKHPKCMKVEHFVQKVYAETNRAYKWRVPEADLGLRFVNSVIMLHSLPRANASKYVLSIYNLLIIFWSSFSKWWNWMLLNGTH